MDTTTLTVRLPRETKDKVEALARATGRSRSYLTADAIQQYLDREMWHIQEIAKAVQEADAGAFADEAEVETAFRGWEAGSHA